jgi:hypothetical protein
MTGPWPVIRTDGSNPVLSSGGLQTFSSSRAATAMAKPDSSHSRTGSFESSSLQQRVRCELDLAARKSQKGRLGTRAASAAHARVRPRPQRRPRPRTGSSNPVPSSGESANFRSLSGRRYPSTIYVSRPSDAGPGPTVYPRLASLPSSWRRTSPITFIHLRWTPKTRQLAKVEPCP